jgi:hypothetical protein
MLPRPRLPRRVVAIAAAGGLAVAALGLAGCDYPAGRGSGVVNTYDSGPFIPNGKQCFVPGADTGGQGAFCAVTFTSDVVIKDDSGSTLPLDTVSVVANDIYGASSEVARPAVANRNPVTGNLWKGYLAWIAPDTNFIEGNYPTLNANARFVEHAVSKESKSFFPDRWFFDYDLPLNAAPNFPAPPVASLFSHDSPAASGPAPLKPTILDARQSSGGTGRPTYLWDTNGDGTFGDDPAGGWTGVPAPITGTAYLPQIVVASSIPAPAVKVTDFGLSRTRTISIPTWDRGAGGLVVAPGVNAGEISLTPDIGTLPYLGPADVHYACIDIGDDGTYDTELTQNMVGVDPILTPTGFYPYLAPEWAGVKRVRVAFFADDPTPLVERGTCTNPAPLAQVLSTHIELVNGTTKAAMERGVHTATVVKRYAAAARVRLAGGAMLNPGTQSGTSVRGIVNRGRYSLRAPARGAGAARPSGLAAFTSGDFASTSDASLTVAANGKAVIAGTTTMVIRGTRKALACIKVAQTDSSTIWTVMGGTGAGRTLRMVMNGGATLNSLMTTAVPVNAKITGKGKSATQALSPVSTTYGINASKGAGRGMSAACKTLVKRLP